MLIQSLTLQNFRCFGAEPTTVELTDLTALIGVNGSGKTAVLQLLSRLFGISQSERRLQRSDFHIPPEHSGREHDQLTLSVEVRIAFPELLSSDDLSSATSSVPEFFQHLIIAEGEAAPFCRLRLDGTWTRSNLPEGEIDEKVYWIKSAADVVGEADKQQLKAYERSRIHVLYVPATRDPSHQLKYISGTLLTRLLNAISWSDDARSTVERASQQIAEFFREEEGLKLFHDKIDSNWIILHDADVYAKPRLRPFSNQLEEIFKQVEVVFSPNEYGTEHDISRLSDGLRSLFYFTLVSSIFDIEREVMRLSLAGQNGNSDDQDVEIDTGDANGNGITDGIDSATMPESLTVCPISLERLSPPTLTVFAIEEPENHLAPHYLARITNLLRRIAGNPAAQVLLTSHSASVLGRVDASCVRYFRLDRRAKNTVVNSITLPAAEDVAYKYVKEAVRAYPELYFSRLIILAEGDSEEIVLPRVAECLDVSLDPSMISVVPLGGRHVNHFWRLLSGLSIPFVTLLDLDRERSGAGWGRIKYACQQLLEIGVDSEVVLVDRRTGSRARQLSADEFKAMDEWDVSDSESMQSYIEWLETRGVFFSAPLDLDLVMLEGFGEFYKSIAAPGGGPRTLVDDAVVNVLGKGGTAGATYSEAQKELFPWYSYLFLNKGKPSTHLLALATIPDAELRESVPAVLRRLVERAKEEIRIERLPGEELIANACADSPE